MFQRIALSIVGTVPASVYIDSVNVFDGVTIADMLTTLRKYGVSITVAHENLHQLSDELRASVLGNCAHKYVFKISMEDAKKLNEHIGPQNIDEDLYKLPLFRVRLFHGQGSKGYVDEDVLPTAYPADPNMPGKVLADSRRNYAIPEKSARHAVARFIEDA
jgi:hypothetical protein